MSEPVSTLTARIETALTDRVPVTAGGISMQTYDDARAALAELKERAEKLEAVRKAAVGVLRYARAADLQAAELQGGYPSLADALAALTPSGGDAT